MIKKLILSGSYDFTDPSTALVPLHSRGVDHGWLEKRAAHGIFAKELQKLADDGGMKGHSVFHVLAVGDEETYGCLAAGTPIALADGRHRNIEDFAVGDQILSATGNDRTVTCTYNRTVATAVKVRIEGLPEPVVMSSEHPLRRAVPGSFDCERSAGLPCKPGLAGRGALCRRRGGCPLSDRDWSTIPVEDCTASQLTDSDYLIFDLPVMAPPREISAEEARLLGYWLAEGSFQKRHSEKRGHHFGGLRFSFGRHERETLVADALQLTASMGMPGHVYDQTEERGEYVVTATGNMPLYREWDDWCGNGAGEKHIPLWMLSLPAAIKEELLYGYLMGDGTACVDYRNDARVTASSVSYDLAVGVQRLLWSLGVSASMCRVKATPADDGMKRRTLYMVSYALAKAPARLTLGAEFKPRKWSSVRNFIVGNRVFLAVRGVAEIEWNRPVYNLEVDTDHDYVSVNFYSHNCNRNFDGFGGTDNATAHARFKSHGNVFKHHKNTDPVLKTGAVLGTAHNADMHRIELLIALENAKYADELEGWAKGEDIAVSMGSMQDYDTCSICKNKARTSKQHCDHIKTKLGEVLEGGRQVYMQNPNPKYFDISTVYKPADRIGYALAKVASQNGAVGGHDLAEAYGLRGWDTVKQATLMRLAEIEKRVDGLGRPVVSGPADLSDDERCQLKQAAEMYGVDAVLGTLHARSLMLSYDDFADVIVGQSKLASMGAPDLRGGFQKLAHDNLEVTSMDGADRLVPLGADLRSKLAMDSKAVQDRAVSAILRPTVKLSGAADTASQGLGELYLHYKLAFASHDSNRDREDVLTAVAISNVLRA